MGKVTTHMTMSLDGYIAKPDDDPAELFDWYFTGDVEVPNPSDVTFRTDAVGAEELRKLTDNGALIAGRRLFDMTNGWDDRHPGGAPVVVVTHRPPPDDAAERLPKTRFAGSVEDAVALAREIAGGKDVTIMSPDIIGQALDLGLVDEVCVSLVPVIFGEGIPYFGTVVGGHVMLEDPTVVQGARALHLRYPVRR